MNPLLAIPKLLFYIVVSFFALGTVSALFIGYGALTAAAMANVGAGLLANWMCLRLFERLPLSAAGFTLHVGWLKNVGLGLAAGLTTVQVVIFTPVLLGWSRWEADPERPLQILGFLGTTALLLVGAAGEELLIRGYFLQLLVRPATAAGAVIFTSTIFAILHGANEGVTDLALVNTGLYGAVLGYSYIRSQDLWFPTGIHFAWNWALVAAGASLSGFKLEGTGTVLRPLGPDLLSGGAYGPEGSLVATGTAVLLFALVHWLPVAQGDAPLLAQPARET